MKCGAQEGVGRGLTDGHARESQTMSTTADLRPYDDSFIFFHVLTPLLPPSFYAILNYVKIKPF